MSKYLSCPHCQHQATSMLNLGNAFYMYSFNKKCEACKNPIRLNLIVYFLTIFVINPILLIGTYFFVAIPIIKHIKNNFSQFGIILTSLISIPGLLLLLIILNVYGLPYIYDIFHLKLFYKKAET